MDALVTSPYKAQGQSSSKLGGGRRNWAYVTRIHGSRKNGVCPNYTCRRGRLTWDTCASGSPAVYQNLRFTVWVSSRSWWWTGKPGVLQSVGSQRVRHDWAAYSHVRLTDWTLKTIKLLTSHCQVRQWTWACFKKGNKCKTAEITMDG